jgi:PilZ domain
VKETSPNDDPGAEKRRSARLLHAVPIIVTGTDALGQTFRETTATVMVSCTGCKYKSTHYVPKNSELTIEINRTTYPKSRRILKARVVWVQRPSNYRDHFHIAVEFEVPGNVWGLATPPENWFPHPEDIELEIPVTEPVHLESSATGAGNGRASGSYSGSFTSSVERVERPDPAFDRGGSLPHLTAVTTLVAEMPSSPDNPEKTVPAAPPRELPAVSPKREITVQAVVKEALEKELGVFRAQIETQIREAISEAVATALQQKVTLAIEKILEQSNAGSAAIVEQAQKTARELAEKLDEQVRAGAEATATAKPRVPRKSSKRKAKMETPQEG